MDSAIGSKPQLGEFSFPFVFPLKSDTILGTRLVASASDSLSHGQLFENNHHENGRYVYIFFLN